MRILSSFILATGLMISSVASANVMLWLDPTTQPTTGTGDNVSLTLMVSGLGDYSPDSLGGFDVDLYFDASVLSFTGYNLFSFLGDESDFGAEDISEGEYSSGIVNLGELSYLFDYQLDDLQPGMFALAEIFFNVDALATDQSTLISLDVFNLTDGFGQYLDVSVGDDAVISASQVPAPAPHLLFAMALLAICARKANIRKA